MDSFKVQPKFSNWKECPIYIEPYSSFDVNSKLTEENIIDIVKKSLEKSKHADLSFKLKPNGYTFVLCASNELRCRIHFFKKGDKGIIEFQKRYGCIIQFVNFYKEVKSIMMNDYPYIFNAMFNNISGFLYKPIDITSLQKSIFSLEEKDNFNDIYKNLINISQDEHIDIYTNGLSCLASCIDDYKGNFVPLSETENFVIFLNKHLNTRELSIMEYISRILFVLSLEIRFKKSVYNLKKSVEVDICETLKDCLTNIRHITYMNYVIVERLKCTISNFSN